MPESEGHSDAKAAKELDSNGVVMEMHHRETSKRLAFERPSYLLANQALSEAAR